MIEGTLRVIRENGQAIWIEWAFAGLPGLVGRFVVMVGYVGSGRLPKRTLGLPRAEWIKP